MQWFPFSTKATKRNRHDAATDKAAAQEIFDQTLLDKARYVELYQKQREISAEIRTEKRRNHFGEMFYTDIPLRNTQG